MSSFFVYTIVFFNPDMILEIHMTMHGYTICFSMNELRYLFRNMMSTRAYIRLKKTHHSVWDFSDHNSFYTRSVSLLDNANEN